MNKMLISVNIFCYFFVKSIYCGMLLPQWNNKGESVNFQGKQLNHLLFSIPPSPSKVYYIVSELHISKGNEDISKTISLISQ